MNAQHENTDPGDTRLDALLAVARADKPDTSRAEYGFETRLTARMAAPKPEVALSWWASWTWRLAPVFAVIALSLSLWTRYMPAHATTDDGMVTEWSATVDDDLNGWLLNDDAAR